jgi:hypothetical protein
MTGSVDNTADNVAANPFSCALLCSVQTAYYCRVENAELITVISCPLVSAPCCPPETAFPDSHVLVNPLTDAFFVICVHCCSAAMLLTDHCNSATTLFDVYR